MSGPTSRFARLYERVKTRTLATKPQSTIPRRDDSLSYPSITRLAMESLMVAAPLAGLGVEDCRALQDPGFFWGQPDPSTCKTCCNGTFQWCAGSEDSPESFKYSYSTSRRESQASADNGCRWCTFISKRVLCRVVGKISLLHCDISSRPDATTGGLQILDIAIEWFHVTTTPAWVFSGYLFTTADDPAASLIRARPRVLDVGFSCTLPLAKASIEECIRGHDGCPPPPASTPLPSRLVDCTDPSHLRLIVTKDGLASGKYVALSYVWGPPDEDYSYMTTSHNIDSYANGIDPSRLPQTILDAIYVTRALGIDYLWVDAMCIIQDSDRDKHCEIRRMRNVYRYAFITIVAANARHVSEGFLRQDCGLAGPTGGLDQSCTHFTANISPPFLRRRHPANGITDRSPHGLSRVNVDCMFYDFQFDWRWEPVNSRGWTTQEYLISPRSLVFTSHALQFHCQAGMYDIGRAHHNHEVSEARLPDILFLEDPPRVQYGSEEWRRVRSAWLELVEDYARRSVTMPSDKLTAYGGIAEEFGRVLRTDYLAGLWRDTLLDDLLWRTFSDTPSLCRPAKYRAPSWSWAALDGAVVAGWGSLFQNSKGDWSTLAEVIRCEVALEDADLPFGPVSGGSLTLCTVLISCMWGSDADHDFFYRHSPSSDDSELIYFGVGHLDVFGDRGVEDFWAAPIMWDDCMVQGILITVDDTLCQGKGAEAYRRIGFFYRYIGEVEGDPREFLLQLPRVEIEIV